MTIKGCLLFYTLISYFYKINLKYIILKPTQKYIDKKSYLQYNIKNESTTIEK